MTFRPRYTDTPCGRLIARAESVLGELTLGQKTDLLLDNFEEIANCDAAREILRSVTIEPTRYDYTNQAWLVEGKYVRCGHPEEMPCQCFGRLHEGEEWKQPDSCRCARGGNASTCECRDWPIREAAK